MDEVVRDLRGTPAELQIGLAVRDDIPQWMSLAEEVLSLFGPMPGFETILMRKIAKSQAYCARASGQDASLVGGVLIGGAGSENWIRWLAVSSGYRRLGIGRKLTEVVIAAVPRGSMLNVETFAEGSLGAVEAGRLYESCGFVPMGLVNVNGQVRQRYSRHCIPQHAPLETPVPPHCR